MCEHKSHNVNLTLCVKLCDIISISIIKRVASAVAQKAAMTMLYTNLLWEGNVNERVGEWRDVNGQKSELGLHRVLHLSLFHSFIVYYRLCGSASSGDYIGAVRKSSMTWPLVLTSQFALFSSASIGLQRTLKKGRVVRGHVAKPEHFAQLRFCEVSLGAHVATVVCYSSVLL